MREWIRRQVWSFIKWRLNPEAMDALRRLRKLEERAPDAVGEWEPTRQEALQAGATKEEIALVVTLG